MLYEVITGAGHGPAHRACCHPAAAAQGIEDAVDQAHAQAPVVPAHTQTDVHGVQHRGDAQGQAQVQHRGGGGRLEASYNFV